MLLLAKLGSALVASLVVAAAFNGCGERDTVVLMRVDGSTAGTISQFAVTLSVSNELRSFTIPDQKRSINLPTSFTVQIPPSFEGVATVQVKALNDEGVVIGEGTSTTSAVAVGRQNTIEIQIAPVIASTGDGGAPKLDAAGTLPTDGSLPKPKDGGAGDVPKMDGAGDPPKLDAAADGSTPDGPALNPDAGAMDAMTDA